jgi:hypothetical protein
MKAGAPLRESSDPMREAGAPRTWELREGATLLSRVCAPHRGESWSHRPRSRATLAKLGREAKAAPEGSVVQAGAANNTSIIKAGARKPRPRPEILEEPQ